MYGTTHVIRQVVDLLSENGAWVPSLWRLEVANQRAWGATLRLAEPHGLTSYDTAYLELAQRRGLPLATLDRGLRAAASTESVILLGMCKRGTVVEIGIHNSKAGGSIPSRATKRLSRKLARMRIASAAGSADRMIWRPITT